jgi:hypothetical protein
MIPKLKYLLSLAILGTPVALLAAEDPNLPKAEETEYYSPVPPIITANEGQAPSDAVVLFDGTNLNAWEPVKAGSKGWEIVDKALTVIPKSGYMKTKAAFGDMQLHIEFREPKPIGDKKGQARGNSGIFMMGLYELQVLDSYNNTTYVNGQAGSIYKQHPPLVNACRPPEVWQTYDVIFIAPRFASDGSLISPARETVLHNGVLIQYDVVLKGPTEYRGYPKYKAHAAKLPIQLQDHGDRVAYRNIWVREITLPQSK